jgi:hypothetical protein
MRDILRLLAGIEDGRIAWAIMHEMGGLTIAAAIKELVSKRTDDDPLKAAVLHILVLHDLNRMNRNQLTHFMPVKIESGIALWRVKGPNFTPLVIPDSVETLRHISEDINRFMWYVSAAITYLNQQRRGQSPSPLPEKPPLPERLVRPLPPKQPKQPRQRRSSPK